jgi:hypothetical protein
MFKQKAKKIEKMQINTKIINLTKNNQKCEVSSIFIWVVMLVLIKKLIFEKDPC